MNGIRQLAKQLNISIGTVSKALNGRHDVNEKTRKRVLAAARSLVTRPISPAAASGRAAPMRSFHDRIQ